MNWDNNSMDSLNEVDPNYDFIELNRTFHELSLYGIQSDELDFSRKFGIGEHLDWPKLLNEYRVIILSEAGSGKTVEIRNTASKLRYQGKPAFFLRLEHIPGDFENAFEVGTYEGFQAWLASVQEGWLFLDSVDEARLRNPGDFESAIRRLSKLISTAKDRAHIVITGRTTAWRPKTDLAYCSNHLPYAAESTSERDQKVDDDGPGVTLKTETKIAGKAHSVFKIVTLEDLTQKQVAQFIEARGVENSKAFLEAVERADAWSFTSRPQDLQELMEFWMDEARIGSRIDIMRNSINRRLAERDQNRAEARPLAAERARIGAKLLAVACTLAQEQTIRVPDGAENPKGLPAWSVLQDWDEKELSTLLLRPIFDEAIYGTVRFHHRSVREYLTAEWFADLLQREKSRQSIERLFFRNQYGMDIVVPSLRPILPWLVILDNKIRQRVRKIAPEIIFEGGDPSQLPLEVRRCILHEVCEQMADRISGQSLRDYSAVQRFATYDITDDVRTLIRKYADNRELKRFLLRMVWIGKLAGALPEALEVALTPGTDRYTRISAFRAVKAVGSDQDQIRLRLHFLAEAKELKRELLAELIDGMESTEEGLKWMLESLERSQSSEPYTVDHLQKNLTEYVDKIELDLLPRLISGLNRILSCPPMIDARHCKVSEQYKWLLTPAAKALERLISARHSASLEPCTLGILHKLSEARGYHSNELERFKSDFSTLVPAWKELNRALFWFEVEKSRESLIKELGKGLDNFWQATIFGPFWNFKEDDFEYVAGEIANKDLLDDRLVALSLAFHLYSGAHRPSAWRLKLKKLVAGSKELSDRLSTYLKPPAESIDVRRWKRQESEWKRRDEENRKKRENYHAGWKEFFKTNLDKAQADLKKPGLIPNALLYLYDQISGNKMSTGRWTQYNWKKLIPEYGEKVARFYRDGTVLIWRQHKPKLRSEGAPFNQTTYAVIMGLTGIEIEATEMKNWPKGLSPVEVELACRYASFELNGFPTWFPKLFETYPKIVSDFLIQEIRYELSIEIPEKDAHYILSDISWSGQWAWDHMAPIIFELLKKKEPKNLSNLDDLLKIVQGSNLSNFQIQELASLKCTTLRKLDNLARWFAVWTGVAPEPAIQSLKARIGKISGRKNKTLFAMAYVTYLLGERRGDGVNVREGFKKPAYLKELYLLMHEHIRIKEDIQRAGKGVYSPGLRDHAQEARSNLFGLLKQIPGKESFLAMMEIAEVHPEASSRPSVLLHAKEMAEQEGDMKPWSPSQVRDFNDKLERTPSNHRELADFAVLRFLDLKDDLENGDSSIAGILKIVTQEPDLRKYIGGQLRDKAFGRYSIPQEEELADGKKPDLRFHGVGFDGPIPVELKLADKWTGPSLFERLENQLCGDYLRDNRSNRGIFLLVNRGEKAGWEVPGKIDRVDFSGLVSALQEHWRHISPRFPKVDEIMVIGIDLPKREI